MVHMGLGTTSGKVYMGNKWGRSSRRWWWWWTGCLIFFHVFNFINFPAHASYCMFTICAIVEKKSQYPYPHITTPSVSL